MWVNITLWDNPFFHITGGKEGVVVGAELVLPNESRC